MKARQEARPAAPIIPAATKPRTRPVAAWSLISSAWAKPPDPPFPAAETPAPRTLFPILGNRAAAAATLILGPGLPFAFRTGRRHVGRREPNPAIKIKRWYPCWYLPRRKHRTPFTLQWTRRRVGCRPWAPLLLPPIPAFSTQNKDLAAEPAAPRTIPTTPQRAALSADFLPPPC